MVVAVIILLVAGCSENSPTGSQANETILLTETDKNSDVEVYASSGSFGNQDDTFTISGKIIDVDYLKLAFVLDNGEVFFLSEDAKVVLVNDKFASNFDYRLIAIGMNAFGIGEKQKDGTYLVNYLELRVETRAIDSRSDA
jgi:hypothetical protein